MTDPTVYEHDRLYLIDVEGITREVHYSRDGLFRFGEDFSTMPMRHFNPRPAIVLDPQDAVVQRFVERYSGIDARSTGYRLADKIAAQITPPKPVMAEPDSLGAVVEDDRGVWVRAHCADVRKRWYAPGDVVWDDWASMVNPRPYEGGA